MKLQLTISVGDPSPVPGKDVRILYHQRRGWRGFRLWRLQHQAKTLPLALEDDILAALDGV